MPAENFSFKASCAARIMQPEKFVRPDLSRTGILYYGLAGWKYELVKTMTNIIRGITSMVACLRAKK